MSRLLEGVKVVELADFIAGPCCAKALADWGAEVVKVERLTGDGIRVMNETFNAPNGELENPMFEQENANKKGISLNIKSEEGMKVMHKLLSEADVFITNNRMKALKKMGLDYDTLKEKYPTLVFSHVLGYGEKGPLKDKPGFDYTAYFARGGVSMSLMQKGTAPCNCNPGFGDHYAGITLAAGTLAALYHAKITGKGEYVSGSLFHNALYGLGTQITTGHYGNELPISRELPNSPLLNFYKTKDGKWLQLALVRYNAWLPKFAEVINRPILVEDDKFNCDKNMVNNVAEMTAIITDAMSGKTRDEWVKLLEEADLPHEIFQTNIDLLDDEQAWACDFLVKTKYENGNEGVVVSNPVKFRESEFVYNAAPTLGRDTKAVLADLGYSAEDIEKLAKNEDVKCK